MTTLFELTAEYKAISDRLSEGDFDEQTVIDTLESIGGEMQEKFINVAKVCRNLESDADQIKKAEAQMAERRNAIEKRAASIRQCLLTNMDMAGVPRIESPWFCISIKNNPESVVIDDAVALPKEYMRETISYAPDKIRMKSEMQDGIVISGAHLDKTKRLEIK